MNQEEVNVTRAENVRWAVGRNSMVIQRTHDTGQVTTSFLIPRVIGFESRSDML